MSDVPQFNDKPLQSDDGDRAAVRAAIEAKVNADSPQPAAGERADTQRPERDADGRSSAARNEGKVAETKDSPSASDRTEPEHLKAHERVEKPVIETPKPTEEQISQNKELADAQASHEQAQLEHNEADPMRAKPIDEALPAGEGTKQAEAASDRSKESPRRTGSQVEGAADNGAAGKGAADKSASKYGEGDRNAEGRHTEHSGRGQVGYRTGSDTLSRSAWDKMLNATPGARENMRDPTKVMVIVGHASRLGRDADNQGLSARRAVNAADFARDEYGAVSGIEISAVGSDNARARGDAATDDDPSMRTVEVSFRDRQPSDQPTPEQPKPHEGQLPLIDVPRVPETKNPTLREGAKEVAKDVYDLVKGGPIAALKLTGKETVEAVMNLAEVSHQADMQVKSDLYKKAFADAFTDLTNANDSIRETSKQRYEGIEDSLSVRQIEDSKGLHAGDRNEFFHTYDQIAQAAQHDALVTLNKMSESDKRAFMSAHPDDRDRRLFVLSELNKPHR